MVRAGLLGLGLLACSTAAAREPAPVDDRATPGARALDRTLVVGTLIAATIQDSLTGRRRLAGALVAAVVSADVRNARRRVVIPAGSPVALRVATRRPVVSGSGPATMTLEVRSLTVGGRRYPVTGATTEPSGTRIFFVLPEGLTVGPE